MRLGNNFVSILSPARETGQVLRDCLFRPTNRGSARTVIWVNSLKKVTFKLSGFSLSEYFHLEVAVFSLQCSPIVNSVRLAAVIFTL